MKKIEAPKHVWVATYIMRGGSSGVSVFKARSHAREFVRKYVNPSLEHTICKYVLPDQDYDHALKIAGKIIRNMAVRMNEFERECDRLCKAAAKEQGEQE